jgi:predicted lipoprotein with Yx(FWY)xxD motif
MTRMRTLGLALATALLLIGAAQAATSSSRALVAVRKTSLGAVLVDSRGRTLYLFEKDRRGQSMCNSSCASYWPPLTSARTPRAGKGVHQSLLGLTRAGSGVRQVTYAGHPLYTFIGDKRAGQTSGEGLNNFGARWYAVGSNGSQVARTATASGSGGYGGYGG